MTIRYGDTCPACGSSHVIPYAVIIGGSEEYGYQCQACEVSWPVLTNHDMVTTDAAVRLPYDAVRESTDGDQEGSVRARRHAGLAVRGRFRAPSPAYVHSSRPAVSR